MVIDKICTSFRNEIRGEVFSACQRNIVFHFMALFVVFIASYRSNITDTDKTVSAFRVSSFNEVVFVKLVLVFIN